ncbi:MAG: hypothetical protein E7663_05225 [Ruminococcaceae bacterium]|nr:hypothetical protein [Oscillospiraceae bacterium]
MKSNSDRQELRRRSARVREMCVFAMLGAMMFCSKLVMDVLPNIHLIGMLLMSYTVAFRTKALIPLYIFVLLCGVYMGFSAWWVPYLYVWTVLWGLTMLLPRRLPRFAAYVCYPVLCALHGLAFGTLYAPMQALLFGLDFRAMLAWIVAGFPFDVVHGVSNLIVGVLVLPFSELLIRLMRQRNL